MARTRRHRRGRRRALTAPSAGAAATGGTAALVPVPSAPPSGGRSRAIGAIAVGATAALGALAGWALDRRWLSDDAGGDGDDDVGTAGEAGLVLPDGDERVVVTDDGAELAVIVIQPDGARRGRLRRRRWRPATVVLVHGWTNTRAVWGPVVRRLLAAGHPVIAYDQRGHGASTFGPEAPTVQRLGQDLAAVLDQLDVRDAVLVGHSMGGFSIMAWAVDHRDEQHDRARGLALAGTAAHGLGFGSLDQLASKVVGGRALNWVLGRPRFGLLVLRGAVGRYPRHRDLTMTRDLFLATKPAVRAACYLLCTRMDLRPGLPSIDLPTVVLSGGRDSVTPARLGRTIADTIPGARFELLPDAGHLIMLEETDRVVEAVLRLAGDDEPAEDDTPDGDEPADEVPLRSVAD